jgi:hypothetical protein
MYISMYLRNLAEDQRTPLLAWGSFQIIDSFTL